MQFGRNHRVTGRATRRRGTMVAAAAAMTALGTLSVSGSVFASTTSHAANPYKTYYSALNSDESEATSGATLSEAGSTLFQPLFGVWADSKPLGLTIDSSGGGSGEGQTDAENNLVQIGASDFPRLPSAPNTYISVPVVVGAQEIFYNIPGIAKSTHVKLNASLLNGIYDGSITNWDNSKIAKVNKGVKFPNLAIVPVHRTGSSGDSYLFTTYVNDGTSNSFVASTGPSPEPTWPNDPAAIVEGSNTAVLSECEATSGCVAYVGSSYLRSVLTSSTVNTAELLNGAGNYVQINVKNITNELDSYHHLTLKYTTLIDSKNVTLGWPIVGFEWANVNTSPGVSNPKDVVAFLAWAMDPRKGASAANLNQFLFEPLPAGELVLALSQLKKIS